jgi:hypothetical protein
MEISSGIKAIRRVYTWQNNKLTRVNLIPRCALALEETRYFCHDGFSSASTSYDIFVFFQ